MVVRKFLFIPQYFVSIFPIIFVEKSKNWYDLTIIFSLFCCFFGGGITLAFSSVMICFYKILGMRHYFSYPSNLYIYIYTTLLAEQANYHLSAFFLFYAFCIVLYATYIYIKKSHEPCCMIRLKVKGQKSTSFKSWRSIFHLTLVTIHQTYKGRISLQLFSLL